MSAAEEMWGKGDTVDVYANPLVALWMREKAKREPVAFCRLVEDNRERFERLYGKGEKVKSDGQVSRIWELEELGIPLLLGAGERGSIYKIHYPGGERAFAADRKMGSAVTAFLEKLLLNLSGFGQRVG